MILWKNSQGHVHLCLMPTHLWLYALQDTSSYTLSANKHLYLLIVPDHLLVTTNWVPILSRLAVASLASSAPQDD
jgi:hypothetical protein